MVDDAMSRCAALIRRQSARLDAAAHHPLLRAMRSGTIDAEVFARYLAYEGAFVRIAARANGYLIWQSPDWRSAKRHADVLADLVGRQENYFSGAGAEAAIVSLAECPGPLGEYILAAQRAGYGAVVTCFCAAETLYASWCAVASWDTNAPEDVIRWIRLHTAPGFAASVDFWQERVDAISETELDDRELDQWFSGMLDAEDAFHDLPLLAEGAAS